MGTSIRPVLKESNEYYIPKHRFYELKHFCLQYDDWKLLIRQMEEAIHGARPSFDDTTLGYVGFGDSTGNQAVRLAQLKHNCELVESSIRSSDAFLAKYLMMAVTKEVSYTTLKTKYRIPCGKDLYYNRYRKFFWILSQKR